MTEKSGLEIAVGVLGKGILLGVGLWGIDRLVRAQQQRDKDNLKMMSEIAVDVATKTVKGVGESYMTTMLGERADDSIEQHGDQSLPDNDPLSTKWIEDGDIEQDWTENLVPSIDTTEGHRVGAIEPGESLIPGIPRPDLGGENLT